MPPLVLNFTEILGIPPRADSPIVFHQARGALIPFFRVILDHIILAVKMEIPEAEPVNRIIVLGCFHKPGDGGQVLLVHDFIRLDIKSPTAAAAGQGQVGLLRKKLPAFAQAFIPGFFKNRDLGRMQGLQARPGFLVLAVDVDDKFITDRQNRLNGFQEGIIKFLGAAQNGKPAAIHEALHNRE
jgi:hypothetical protein